MENGQLEQALSAAQQERDNVTERLMKMRKDLKDALEEIERRGHRIQAIEAVARGFVDVMKTRPESKDDEKKVGRLLGEAYSLGLV